MLKSSGMCLIQRNPSSYNGPIINKIQCSNNKIHTFQSAYKLWVRYNEKEHGIFTKVTVLTFRG